MIRITLGHITLSVLCIDILCVCCWFVIKVSLFISEPDLTPRPRNTSWLVKAAGVLEIPTRR